MNKKKNSFVGIDISKSTFNAHWRGADKRYANDRAGWRKLLAELPSGFVYAMEATGNYHIGLAAFLYSKGCSVRVYNPLRVKRWIQSFGNKAKTDKRDARLIAEYAEHNEVFAVDWKPLAPKLARARTIVALLSSFSRLGSIASNAGHALSFRTKEKDLLLVMPEMVDAFKEQTERLEAELVRLVSALFPVEFRNVKSIPGIGAKTAAVLLVCVRGFDGFETAKQAASFVGLAPSVNESGSSVKGSGRVLKTGNSYLRRCLFMCAMSAKEYCESCSAHYSRMIAKGKPAMVALVAIMHRLVRIAFGVVKAGQPYRMMVKEQRTDEPT